MKSDRGGQQYWSRLLILTSISLLAAIVITLIGTSYQQAIYYTHPPRQIASGESLSARGIEFQEVELVTEDNVKLSAWYTPSQNGAVILVAHGFGGTRSEAFYELFASHGYGVVAWDFRVHGKSEGEVSTFGYNEALDTKAALDFALAQPGVEHIGAWGGSMGGVTVIRAAARYPEIKAVVADSPFATLEDEAKLVFQFPVTRWLVQYFAGKETGLSFDLVRPVDDIARISPRPVFIIQGLADTAVPVDSAQRLYDAASDPRTLWLEEDVPHVSMYGFHKEEYIERVIGFFDKYLLDK